MDKSAYNFGVADRYSLVMLAPSTISRNSIMEYHNSKNLKLDKISRNQMDFMLRRKQAPKFASNLGCLGVHPHPQKPEQVCAPYNSKNCTCMKPIIAVLEHIPMATSLSVFTLPLIQQRQTTSAQCRQLSDMYPVYYRATYSSSAQLSMIESIQAKLTYKPSLYCNIYNLISILMSV